MRQYNQSAIADVHEVVQSLHHRVNTLPPVETVNLEPISQSFGNLVQRFDNRPELEQIQELHKAISSLPHSLEVEKAIAAQIEKSVLSLALDINRQLAAIKPYKYQLVIDRKESRDVLMKAFDQAESFLILVCPWIGYGVRDFNVISQIESLLQRKVFVHIGWGMLRDIENIKSNVGSGSIRERLKLSGYYNALPALEALEKKYPKYFMLKLLGTHEKFLVCDRAIAMLGSHNFLTSGNSSSEREVGLETNDPQIIQDLIERFKNAKDLEKQ